MAPIHLEWHLLLAYCMRLILWGSAEIGKSAQLIAYVAWRIGTDPSYRVVIASKNKEKAAQIISAITMVMRSRAYREVFPHIVIVGANANTIRVHGWDGKNPTVQAYQFKAPITGNRVDLLIFDDILDRLNTRTENMRNEYFQFYKDTYVSRLTARGQIVFISNAWHPRDLMHRLKAEKMWVTRRYPIWRPATPVEIEKLALQPDPRRAQFVDDRGTFMVSIWPAQWPLSRILERRDEYGEDLIYWRRTYECEAIDDASVTWQRGWIDKCEAQGKGLYLVRSLNELQGETFRRITAGIDVATARPKARQKTDESSITVCGQRQDGKKRLLWIECGRWFGPELVSRIRDIYIRFRGIQWVESNGAQKIVQDFAVAPVAYGSPYEPIPEPEPVPVKCYDTVSGNKYDSRHGVEAMGVEQECGIWVYPNGDGKRISQWDQAQTEYQRLIGEMMGYDPYSHTGDRLMSKWIANEGLRLGGGAPDVAPGYSSVGR